MCVLELWEAEALAAEAVAAAGPDEFEARCAEWEVALQAALDAEEEEVA